MTLEPSQTQPWIRLFYKCWSTRQKISQRLELFIHRKGKREDRLSESVMLVERFIQFIQVATGTDKGNNKLRVFVLSCGGHDSNNVVKEIYDKPKRAICCLLGPFICSVATTLFSVPIVFPFASLNVKASFARHAKSRDVSVKWSKEASTRCNGNFA
jgi:hypothetical protein